MLPSSSRYSCNNPKFDFPKNFLIYSFLPTHFDVLKQLLMSKQEVTDPLYSKSESDQYLPVCLIAEPLANELIAI